MEKNEGIRIRVDNDYQSSMEARGFLKRKEDFYKYPEKYIVEPFCIIGNLYFVGNKDVGSYLIHTEEGIILIDTGYPGMQGLLVYSITRLGFQIEDIKKIVHTHGHFDHIGATALLKKISGAKTYMGVRDADMLRNNPELSLKYLSGCPYFVPVVPDNEMHDGDIVRLGSTEIKVVDTPGHSDGTVSLFFDIREGNKTYRCGLMGGAGINTLSTLFVKTYHREYAREEFLNSIDKIYNEKVDINLGNHTSASFTLEKRSQMVDGNIRNPFINSNEWKTYLDTVKKRYYDMLNEDKKKGVFL